MLIQNQQRMELETKRAEVFQTSLLAILANSPTVVGRQQVSTYDDSKLYTEFSRELMINLKIYTCCTKGCQQAKTFQGHFRKFWEIAFNKSTLRNSQLRQEKMSLYITQSSNPINSCASNFYNFA